MLFDTQEKESTLAVGTYEDIWLSAEPRYNRK
jgi:hypothetical protein